MEKDGVGIKEKKINGRSDCLEKRSGSCNRTGKEKMTDTGYAAGEDGSAAGWRKVLVQERSTSGFDTDERCCKDINHMSTSIL